MLMPKDVSIRKNQNGLVSITVTMVIMIIVTLLVSSYALIVRREQRRSLDRQLSSQAFYAAEVGVQDAVNAINGGLTGDITECDPSNPSSFVGQTGGSYNQVVSDNTEYSCVLVDRTPGDYTVDVIHPDEGGFVVPIDTADPVYTIRVSWQDSNGDTNFEPNSGMGAAFGLPQSTGGTIASLNVPMLRAVVMPSFREGAMTRDDINNQAHTMYLYPRVGSPANPGTVGYIGNAGPTNTAQGSFTSGNCNSNNGVSSNTYLHCNVDVNIPAAYRNRGFYVYIQPLYKSAKVKVQALDIGGDPLPLRGAQADIDVTGKSADVLRRVRARVPIADGLKLRNLKGLLPPGALVTQDDICKVLSLDASQVTDSCTTPSTTSPL